MPILKRLFIFSFLGLVSLLTINRSTTAAEPPLPDTLGPVYGVNFVNSVDHPADAQQLANGRLTGATWNRWPLYWSRIETSAGVFDWGAHDAIVDADARNGWRTNAILLGTPPFYTTNYDALADCLPAPTAAAQTDLALATLDAETLGHILDPNCGEDHLSYGNLSLNAVRAAAPQGLHDSVFTDGSDVPGAGKTINPNNRWARFVFAIVQRYKPGGTLAQANSWPAGWGITHWEMWNEPDFSIFWDSSLGDYARLLKVGYLAAKHADPQAQVLFGGLANNGDLEFYNKVLDIYGADGLAPSNNYFHDIFVTHSYSQSWHSWYHVFRAQNSLTSRGLQKPIWLNESGVPAWDDYPGPVWDPKSGLRATMAEQADFILQSAFYALYAGADGIFHFQLYDGCGNQPAFTDFPPHHGELCTSDGKLKSDPSKPCAGDANGLFRNPTDFICFTQHPQPESARPSLTAYQILTQHVQGVQPLWRSRPGGPDPYNGPQELIALYKPSTGERLIGMWSRDGGSYTAEIEAQASSATLIYSDGRVETIYPSNGMYRIPLPAATNQNAFWDPSLYMIGGRTRILVEKVGSNTIDNSPPIVTASASAQLPEKQHINVNWSAVDVGVGSSGVKDFSVSVSTDNGSAVPWLTNTTQTAAIYSSQPEHIYRFYITARDNAGNQSEPKEVVVITLTLDPQMYLPIVGR